jgi:hypothetical protein
LTHPTRDGTVLFAVIATLPIAKKRAVKKPAKLRRGKFWARAANPELDRSGDWLLANLPRIRAEAASRAHPR